MVQPIKKYRPQRIPARTGHKDYMNRISRVESQREVHVLVITLHRQMPMPPRASLERLADLAFG